ncbi:MAG: MMPL family transporter, partial [Rhodospirillaceae bacterium]|nr:MMPL family transporter [Rhodospirillaceae bacterium]
MLLYRPNLSAGLLLVLGFVDLGAGVATSHAMARVDDRALLIGITAMHHLGAAVWIGGLPCFLSALRNVPAGEFRRAIAARYSLMCMIAVAGIAFSGIGMLIHYVGSVDAMYGTAYGMMLSTKTTLFVGLLALGYGNFRVVRSLAGNPNGSILRLRRFAEVELGVGITIFFVAASMTSLPPAVDLTRDRVSLSEITERLAPKMPALVSPSRDTLAFYEEQKTLAGEKAENKPATLQAYVPGAGVPLPRNAQDIAWSEYNHHWGRPDRADHGHPGAAREDRQGAVGAALAAAADRAGGLPVPALRGGGLADRQPVAGGFAARSGVHPAQDLHGPDDGVRRIRVERAQPGHAERLGKIRVSPDLCARWHDAADAFAFHRQCQRAAVAGDDPHAAGRLRHLVGLDPLAGVASGGRPGESHRRLAVADLLLPHRPHTAALSGNLRPAMLERIVERSVAWAIDHAKLVIALSVVLTVAAAVYTARTLTMDTDTARMINAELPWKQQMAHINAAFPQNVGLLVVMVDGENPDTAENAAAALFAQMKERTDLFDTVRRADGGPFFDQYGMMLLPTEELQQTANSVIRAQGFVGSLAADPSLRGLFDVLSLAMEGVAQKATDFASLERPLSLISESMSSALTGSEVPLCWRCLMLDRPVDPRELRKLILAQPKRDFQALQPGAKATAAVRGMTRELALTPDHGVTVRLTGQVPLSDEEFGTVAEGMGWALFLSIVLVLGLLFAALRSVKLIIACFVTLIVGLIWTFGFTALAIGSLNLVSIAFAVMFIGLSIDFGIQFGVRYGQERFIANDGSALPRTGSFMARPLTIAAIAIAAGFLSFTPTDYKGVSELGLIAAAGMAITLLLNLTLLPALLKLFPPASRPLDMGFPRSAPIDAFLLRRRWLMIGIWAAVGIVGVFAALALRFDFNPLHLKDPKVESVASMVDLMQDPLRTPYNIEILTPDIGEAQALAEQLGKLREAHDAFAESVQLRRTLLQSSDDSATLQSDLALSLRKAGSAAQALFQLEIAKTALSESLSLSRDLLSESGPSPSLLRELIGVLLDAGGLARDIGEFDRAKADFEESVQLCRRRRDELGDTPETLRDLSAALRGLGQVELARARVRA